MVKGFKAGLEIHQQLSGAKLYSRKASVIVESDEYILLKRRIGAVSSELGIEDSAASRQAAKKRLYKYKAYPLSCGLIEADEEPPSPISIQALNTALQYCKMTNTNIMDHGIVMRKIVVDGSNTTGFQRTMLLGMNGQLSYKNKKIIIDTICLEEDSAKNEGEYYNLSRLGIPLIEIATSPCFKTYEELKEGALEIGRTLRLLDVKRGLGTIRQDVNISIEGGSRVEIKGAQDVRTLDELAMIEAKRQEKIIGFGREIKNRNAIIPKEDDITNITMALKDSNSPIIMKAVKDKKEVLGVRLKGFRGLLGTEIMPNKRIGTDLSDYAKTYTSIKGLLHSDEQSSIISGDDHNKIIKSLECDDNDAYIIIVGVENTVRMALGHAITRLESLSIGVPSEVRRANNDNTTSYLREMPGSARMYPETDLESIRLSNIKVSKPKSHTMIRREYKRMGIGDEMVRIIMDSPLRNQYDELITLYPGNEMLIAKALFLYTKEAKKRHGKEVRIDNNFMVLLKGLCEQKIIEDSFVDAIAQLDKKTPKELMEKYAPIDKDKIRGEIKSIVENLTKSNPNITRGALMGEIMKHYAGRLSGKDAMQLLSEALSESD